MIRFYSSRFYSKLSAQSRNPKHQVSFLKNWEVEFDPESVDAIEPGDLKQVEMKIIPEPFTLTSPMELNTDATATIIGPMRKSTRSIVTMEPMESISISRFSGPLPLAQSVLIVVP